MPVASNVSDVFYLAQLKRVFTQLLKTIKRRVGLVNRRQPSSGGQLSQEAGFTLGHKANTKADLALRW